MFSLLSFFFFSHSFSLQPTLKIHIGTSLGRSPMVTFTLLVLSNRYFHWYIVLIFLRNGMFLTNVGVCLVWILQGILINGQFPGPQIDAVTNENLIISVYNYLREPFLISWYISRILFIVLFLLISRYQ